MVYLSVGDLVETLALWLAVMMAVARVVARVDLWVY